MKRLSICRANMPLLHTVITVFWSVMNTFKMWFITMKIIIVPRFMAGSTALIRSMQGISAFLAAMDIIMGLTAGLVFQADLLGVVVSGIQISETAAIYAIAKI